MSGLCFSAVDAVRPRYLCGLVFPRLCCSTGNRRPRTPLSCRLIGIFKLALFLSGLLFRFQPIRAALCILWALWNFCPRPARCCRVSSLRACRSVSCRHHPCVDSLGWGWLCLKGYWVKILVSVCGFVFVGSYHVLSSEIKICGW